MKKILIFVFYLFIQLNSFGQNNLLELKKTYLACREKKDQDCAYNIAQKMTEITKSDNDSSFWFNLSRRYLANSLVSLDKKDEALKYYLQILNYYSKNENEDLAVLLNNIGNVYMYLGSLNEAKIYMTQALKLFLVF
jgi:tetratricopeptide (TPR) repeat protein